MTSENLQFHKLIYIINYLVICANYKSETMHTHFLTKSTNACTSHINFKRPMGINAHLVCKRLLQHALIS